MRIRMQRARFVDTDDEVTFSFEGKVVSHVVGVSYWEFSYGPGKNDHHNVHRVALSVQSHKGKKENEIACQVTCQLSNKTGTHIAEAKVVVGCVALIEDQSQPAQLTLGNKNFIKNGGRSQKIDLPDGDVTIREAFLSGFDLSYGINHEHYTLRMSAGVGVVNDTITSEVGITNADDDKAVDATIDGGFIAATSDAGLLVKRVPAQQMPKQFDEKFDVEIENAMVFLQKLKVEYPNGKNHNVRKIGGGTSDWTIDGKVVRLQNAHAFMDSEDSIYQDNELSHVEVVIVALPAVGK